MTWWDIIETKSIFKSRTFWINVILAVVAIAGTPEVTSLLGPSGLKYLMAAQSVGNIVLRYFTTQPVTIKN